MATAPHAELPARQFDVVIAVLLRTGVLLAALFVLAGGALYVIKHNAPVRDYHAFRNEPSELRSVSGIVRGALALHAPALIQFGLLILIATPIARVALSLAVFLYEKDWIYVGVTLVVFGLLLYSLLGPHG